MSKELFQRHVDCLLTVVQGEPLPHPEFVTPRLDKEQETEVVFREDGGLLFHSSQEKVNALWQSLVHDDMFCSHSWNLTRIQFLKAVRE